MISQDEFSLFDPQKMRTSVLPDKPGNYIIVLRSTSSLPIEKQFSTIPILTPFDYKNDKYNVVYVGKSSKSLRIRDYKQHFTGTAGNSTARKSLGCLLGFKLIPRDINSPQNGKTTFNEFDEHALTEWMKDNLLLFYYANNDYKNVEKELIRIYNPPLNLQGNFNKTNRDFRRELSALRSCNSVKQSKTPGNQLKTNTCPQQIQCSNCGINLTIDEELKNEEYIKCLSCGCIIQNPIYIQNKKNKKRRHWIVALIFLCIAIIFNISSREYSISCKSSNGITDMGSGNQSREYSSLSNYKNKLINIRKGDQSREYNSSPKSNNRIENYGNNERGLSSTSDKKIIGKWYDVIDADLNTFYELYKKDGKIYLNYSDVKTVECDLYKIRGEEYIFRDGEPSEIFKFKPGTSVYVGKNLEECIDENGNPYNSNIILLNQGDHIITYSNDYDKRIYDILCTAYKK